MATVELTRHLFTFFPALEGRRIEVDAATVADVIRELDRLAPGIAFYLCDERGRLRLHVNVFVGEERVRDRHRLSDPLAPDARVSIFQALSGGSGDDARGAGRDEGDERDERDERDARRPGGHDVREGGGAARRESQEGQR
jgi:molybdopterin synthase sulfur carrier subunit